MAGDLTRSKCLRFTAIFITVLLGLFAVTASNEFGEEELEDNFDFETADLLYPEQFEESRSAESSEEDDVRYYGRKKYPNYFGRERYGHHQNQKSIAIQPQPYRICIDSSQCRSCKAPKVPTYQPPARSARAESRALEHTFDENQFYEREYELRYYNKNYQNIKPSLPQCNKECKTDVPEVPVKKAYLHPAVQYQPPSYGRRRRPYAGNRS